MTNSGEILIVLQLVCSLMKRYSIDFVDINRAKGGTKSANMDFLQAVGFPTFDTNV